MAKAEWFRFGKGRATQWLRIDQIVYLNGSGRAVVLRGGVNLRLSRDDYAALERLLAERGEDGDEG